ncbi:hypothetical protein D3C78_1536710 [compost metagenome]
MRAVAQQAVDLAPAAIQLDAQQGRFRQVFDDRQHRQRPGRQDAQALIDAPNRRTRPGTETAPVAAAVEWIGPRIEGAIALQQPFGE